MDPVWNCLLFVCCDPLSANREQAMAKLLEHAGMSADEAKKYAPGMLKAFNPLFEALKPFAELVAKLARGADFKP